MYFSCVQITFRKFYYFFKINLRSYYKNYLIKTQSCKAHYVIKVAVVLTCSAFYYLCDTLLDLWNTCIYVCMLFFKLCIHNTHTHTHTQYMCKTVLCMYINVSMYMHPTGSCCTVFMLWLRVCFDSSHTFMY
jgi:hypothetical protein